MSEQKYSIKEIAKLIEAKVIGNDTGSITSLAPLHTATEQQLSYLALSKYKKYLSETKAAAVIVSPEFSDACTVTALVVDNPEFAFAKVAGMFEHCVIFPKGIHKTAVIGEHCRIDSSASIAANCVVGNNVVIGANTVVHPGVIIEDNAVVGKECCFYPNVTIYHGVIIGNDVILHAGAVIGSDGFSFTNKDGQWLRIPQLGTVRIEDRVNIGANTCIDRGAMDDTVIREGVKIDNQVHIAHNVEVGAHTAMAACVGIAGSTKIGKHCMLAGAVGVSGHLSIADGVIITSMSGVMSSITEPGMYSSTPVLQTNRKWRKTAVAYRKLDELTKRVIKLEKESHVKPE